MNGGEDGDGFSFAKKKKKQRRADPIITVYEAQANPADHEKIPGVVGGMQMPQL